MKQVTKLNTVVQGLHATSPQPLPFAPSLEVRAFLLERARGNILIYSTTEHEAMFATDLDAPLFVHERERAGVVEELHVRGTFSRRHMLDEDFEVIPTPGHTAGATAFLWESAGHRMLFTGDSVFLDGGEWIAAFLEGSSDRDAYISSLELIRELDFDVLVPWAARAGGPFHAVTSRVAARRRIDAVIERVRRGGDP